MTRGHSKSYAEGQRQHGVQDPDRTPPLSDVIQDVRIVDDLSHLAVPATVAHAGFRASVGAGVALYSGFEVRAIGRPFVVTGLRVNAVTHLFWIGTANYLDDTRTAQTWGYDQNGVQALIYEGLSTIGPTSNEPRPGTSLWYPGLLVPPGSAFFVSDPNVNTAVAVNLVSIQEIPGG